MNKSKFIIALVVLSIFGAFLGGKSYGNSSSFCWFRKEIYSEYGEDILARTILHDLFSKFENFTYIDIGCNHPIFNSNTYMFYLTGGNGILVDANVKFSKLAMKYRPRDVFINAAVFPNNSKTETTFYQFGGDGGVSTVLPERAEEREKSHGKPEEKKTLVIGVNDLLSRYTGELLLDILSVDVEGLDYEIIKGIDYSKYRPKILLFETSRLERSDEVNIIHFLEEKKYMLVGSTFWNLAFADEKQMVSIPK